jgi:hypothetical protein
VLAASFAIATARLGGGAVSGAGCDVAGFGFAGGVVCGGAAGAAIGVTLPVGGAGAGAGLGRAPPTFGKGCRGCFERAMLGAVA